jgi:hypothetical protein
MQLSLDSRFGQKIGVVTAMLESDDPEGAADAAHNLESSSAQVGALSVAHFGAGDV